MKKKDTKKLNRLVTKADESLVTVFKLLSRIKGDITVVQNHLKNHFDIEF